MQLGKTLTDFDMEAEEGLGDIFTLEEFRDAVKIGAFIESDGSGCYGTLTHYSWDESFWDCGPPQDATHVHWFNK